MKKLIQHYCSETTIHGFRELHHAKSVLSKTFWTTVLIAGIAMTVFQILRVVEHFYSEPTKTEITIMPQDEPYLYPPYQFSLDFFTQWVDLNKVEMFDFDLETFLYTMSYYCSIFTNISINVTKADEKLNGIMTFHNVSNMHDLGLTLSLDKPDTVIKSATFNRYIDEFGNVKYVANTNLMKNENAANPNPKDESEFALHHLKNESEFGLEFDDGTTHYVYFEPFTDFQQTAFHRNFERIFKHNLINEYSFFKSLGLPKITSNLGNSKSAMPVAFYPIGDRSTYTFVNILQYSYDYYLKGTLYKWISTNDRNCTVTDTVPFYAECRMKCSLKHQPYGFESCKLYFISNITTDRLVENMCKNLTVNLNILAQDNWNKFSLCLEECKSNCKMWNFEFTTFAIPHDSHDQVSEDFIEGFVSLTYIARDKVMQISLTPYFTWEDALANVGGLLGLWVGGSIISFIQAIYLLFFIPLETWWSERKMNLNFKEKISVEKLTNDVTLKSVKRFPYNEQSITDLYTKLEILTTEINQIKNRMNEQSLSRTFQPE